MTLSLSLIKQTMDAHLGEHVLVTAQAGRRKLIKRHGVLSETFNSVFVVELDKENSKFERVSYSYTDVLTRNIKIVFDGENSENVDEAESVSVEN